MFDYRAVPSFYVPIPQSILIAAINAGLVKINEEYAVISVYQHVAGMQVNMKNTAIDEYRNLIKEFFHHDPGTVLIRTAQFSKGLLMLDLPCDKPRLIEKAACPDKGNRLGGAHANPPYLAQHLVLDLTTGFAPP
jgi:hypothetical protein